MNTDKICLYKIVRVITFEDKKIIIIYLAFGVEVLSEATSVGTKNLEHVHSIFWKTINKTFDVKRVSAF